MPVSVTETINAPIATVWSVITDIDGAESIVSSITDLTVLERPDSGLLGLKWKESRVMFGKEATETMWITATEDGHWYETTAHNHGMIYHSRMSLAQQGNQTELTMSFDCIPQTLTARLFSLVSFLFNGTVKKAFSADLKDIKQACEASKS